MPKVTPRQSRSRRRRSRSPTSPLQRPPALPEESPSCAPRSGALNLTLEAPRAVDASTQDAIALSLTLVNKGHRAAVVRFRPETLGFEVLGPGGADHCGWSTLTSAPTRDLFATLGPGASLGLTVVLSAYCPTRTFDQSGFYVVRASLDTRKASGAEIGLRSFDGQVIATAPTVVRLRHGVRPEALVRPRLQPVGP